MKIKNNSDLIKKVTGDFLGGDKLKLEKRIINLSELKSLPIIDFEKQKLLKDYIDDLVFALYFGIKISDADFNKVKIIKSVCEKNKFYEIAAKQKE